MGNYGERMKHIRTKLGLKQKEFAERLGLQWHKIKNIETQTHKLTPEIAEKIEQIYSISGWWLLTGKGSMEIEKKKQRGDKDTYEIIRLDLRASAGHGIQNFHTQETLVTIDRSLFPRPVSPQNLRIVPVVGGSMEPTIPDASHIVIDITQNDRIDGIYVIRLDDNIMVKRLQFNLDATVEIISDNPRYATQHYDPTQTQVNFEIIGRKILTIQ